MRPLINRNMVTKYLRIHTDCALWTVMQGDEWRWLPEISIYFSNRMPRIRMNLWQIEWFISLGREDR